MAISVVLTNEPNLWTPLIPGPSPTEAVLLTALDGNDTVDGTNFNDTIYGGQDGDLISGGAGNDFLYGNLGNDTIRGTSGYNEISGGEGDDYLIGGTGGSDINGVSEILFGNEGNDTIRIISGTSLVFGGQGDDTVYVQFSDNTVYANKENDTIIVQGNNAFAHGGDGDDKIRLEVAGPATLIGGKASDTFEFADGVASDALFIKGGGGSEGNEPPAEGEINKILVMGTNDFSGADISTIAEISVVSGATATFDATIFNGTLNGPGSTTDFSGGGIFVLKGTSAEVNSALQHIVAEAGVVIQDSDGNPVTPSTIGLSRAKYDLPTSLTEFFVIDGSQYAAVIPPDSAGALNRSLGALALQFGVITLEEAQEINGLPPGDDVPADIQAKIVAFGTELNSAEYIPQVTLEQEDTLLNGFYNLISLNGIEPVENRFFSVIDTKGTTTDTSDDLTTLYFSSTGDFRTTSSDVETVASYNIPGFTPSNPPLTPVTLATIDPSTQLVPVA